jgi:hypothetical protein
MAWRFFGHMLLRLERYDEGVKVAEKLAGMDPLEHALLAVQCLRGMGLREQAETFAAQRTRGGPPPGRRTAFAWLCAVAGDREKALGILGQESPPWEPYELYEGGCAFAVLGDAESALAWLTRAAEAGYRRPPNQPRNLEALTEDPQIREVLEKIASGE